MNYDIVYSLYYICIILRYYSCRKYHDRNRYGSMYIRGLKEKGIIYNKKKQRFVQNRFIYFG